MSPKSLIPHHTALKCIVPFLSNQSSLVVAEIEGEGEQQPQGGGREKQNPVFPSQDFRTCQSISELPEGRRFKAEERGRNKPLQVLFRDSPAFVPVLAE